MGEQSAKRKLPASERSFEIQAVHRDRPNMTALTELFVRFTLAEANASRAQRIGQVVVRPAVLKPDGGGKALAEEGNITTRPERLVAGRKV